MTNRGKEGHPFSTDRIKKITINVSLEQGDYLEGQATERNITLSDVLREAIWLHQQYQLRILSISHLQLILLLNLKANSSDWNSKMRYQAHLSIELYGGVQLICFCKLNNPGFYNRRNHRHFQCHLYDLTNA